MKIANNIKEIVTLLGIQQKDIAEKIGISKQLFAYNLKVKKPEKYNKEIADILGIKEAYISQETLSTIDILEIQKQNKMKCSEQLSIMDIDDNRNIAKEIADLNRSIKNDKLMKEIYGLVVDEQFSSTNTELENAKYKMLKAFSIFLKNQDSIEYLMLKDLLYSIRSSDYSDYRVGVINDEQRKELYSKIKEMLNKFDEENKKNNDGW